MTYRFIFSWENDGNSSGANPPASIDDISLCTTPTAFNVTGGGNYCTGGGKSVGLDGSEVGVDYQLMDGPTPVGSPLPGTGLALDFGLQPGTVTYTVVATSGTCTNNMSGSATVTIDPPPTVSAGSDFTKSCTSNPSGAAIGEPNDPLATYSWSPTTDLSSSTVSNPTANPSVTTTYTVTKTITATGCTNTASVTVTVDNSVPTVSAGGPFTITCTANTGGGPIGEANDPAATYSWSPGTGLSSSTVSNPNANPASTQTYTVTKTITSSGCIATASVVVTVDKNPPAVSAGSPFTKTCTSNTTGAPIGEPNDPTATYSWNPGTGLSSTTTSNPTANPGSTQTYTVTKTSTATGCTNTASVIVTVDITPPSVSAGSPFTKTCTANTSGATIGEANDPNATYSWNPTTGLSSSTVSNPNANPGTTQTYTVTKTSTATGCTNTASVIVTVDNSVPAVSAGSPFTITCVSNTSGKAIGEPNDPTATYSWSPATGLSSSTVSNPNANPASTQNYTVTKTITATGCTASASVVVTVDNTPPAVSAGTPFTKTCTSNTTGAAIGEANDPAATYSWNPTTGLSSSTVSNPNANPGSTQSYTVTKTSTATGCTNTASVTVTVNVTPPTVSAGSPFTKTCSSNSTGAVIGETNDPTATYSWSPAAGLSSSTVSNPTANPAATTPYTVTKTNIANGCTATASVTVTVDNGIPVVSIAGSSALCLPATTTLSPTTGGSWISSNNAVATVTNGGLVTGVSGGTVTFTFTQASTGCSNTTAAVDVSPTPTVVDPPDQNVCKGAPTAAVNFTGAVSGTTYNWTNDNTSIGLAATGTGNIASFNAVNIGNYSSYSKHYCNPNN